MNTIAHEIPGSNKNKIKKNNYTICVTYCWSHVLGGLYLNERIMIANAYMEQPD